METIKQRVEVELDAGKKSVILELSIYKGFDDIDSLVTQMYTQGIDEKHYMTVKFFDSYYAIINQDSESSAVIGKDCFWIKSFKIWQKGEGKKFKLPFEVDTLTKNSLPNENITKDMYSLDDEIEVLNSYKTGWRNVLDKYQYAPYFLELLGRTFYDTYLDESNIHALNKYFGDQAEGLYREILNKQRITGINPFRSEALYSDGKIYRYMM